MGGRVWVATSPPSFDSGCHHARSVFGTALQRSRGAEGGGWGAAHRRPAGHGGSCGGGWARSIRVASIVDGGDDAGALSRSAADKRSSEEKAHLCALVAARATTGFRGWG